MIVSSILSKAADFNPTKSSQQLSISDICQKIENRKFCLPLYQRDISWTLKKSIDLLNYQLLGKAPVAPISVNKIDAEAGVPLIEFISREPIENGVAEYSVVDGQQRLTTNYKAYTNNPDFRNIVLDVTAGKFLLQEAEIKENQIPVGILLNKETELLNAYVKGAALEDVLSLLLQIKMKFKNYNYTLNYADNLTEDEQIRWFEVLNNAGSMVSAIQMHFSRLKVHGLDVYKEYTKIFDEKLSTFGYSKLFSPQKTIVSYPIAALNPILERKLRGKHFQNNYAPIPSDTKEGQLCNLPVEEIRDCFVQTLKALDGVLNFINENALSEPSRIDYINYMIGVFIFFPFALTQSQNERLIQWYKTVTFTNESNTERRKKYTDLLQMMNT